MTKPELVTVGLGRNNEGIEDAFHRILEGATWKKQRIIVILPAGNDIPTKVALSHWSLMFPPNQPVYRMLAMGQEVGEAYSNAIEEVINHPELSQWEYILTIEHDNTPPPDGVLELIKSMDKHPEYDAISGLYWTRGEGGAPQIWGDPTDPVLNYRPQPPRIGEVQECNGIGMGFALWRVNMFKDEKLRRPWFKTVSGKEGLGTQDLFFWGDAKKHGYRCAVDTNVRVGHFDKASGINW